MENILSGCPVLEVLQLKACRGSNCLNICSPKLTTLEIECWVFGSDGESFLEISAPYILDLTISWIFVDFHFRIKNLSSVVRASFCSFVQDDWETYGTPDVMNSIMQLLESLKSLEELELRPCCIEIFSVLEMKGLKLPPSKVSCLTLTPSNNTESIAGILGFLKSSPNLKTLVIKGRKLYHDEVYVTQDQAAAYLQNGNLDLDLFHLKTMKIIGFKGFLSGPMHMLVQVLLRSAKVLEKIVISAEEEPFEISSTNTTAIDLANFALKLGALPKVSTEAVVLVC
ncbi:hypothetical protein ACJIZ3_025825 [Penstemon smallii]|uniref:At1g61320/AtMIF1 LRR domain-containing protein n=1 Tax=Penstemon smallii TaxID=265156 RepID=A0ABD3TVR0_9LAMI